MKAKLYLIFAILTGSLLVFALILEFKSPNQVHAANTNASTQVSITESGLVPEVVTITVDSKVVWTNLTDTTIHLIGGEPFRVYLPLTIHNGNGGLSNDAPHENLVPNLLEDWVDVEILPSNSYTHTFSTEGTFQYYTSGNQIHTGKVVVEDVASPLFERVLYLEDIGEDPAYAIAQDSPSLELGEGDYEDFTIEMFFYVPDLSEDGWAALARKMDSYAMYINFNNTQPDLIMFEITLMTVPYDIVYELTVETDISVGWHHIAFVFDNEYSVDEDAATIFMDGNRVAHSPDDGNDHFDMPQILPHSWPLVFGRSFNGYIEEIRLSETVRYSNTTYTVPTLPFTNDEHTCALWHFNETEGSTDFLDSSSYGNALTGYDGAHTHYP